MVGKYLSALSKSILMCIPEGLSKVKFAKVIYFVHKKLVTDSLIATGELEFIRMPLGPVPVGFLELGSEQGIKVIKTKLPSLSYDMEVYSLSETTDGLGANLNKVVSDCVLDLNKLSTSELVEASHKDRSWIDSTNGSHFTIQISDLDTGLPLSTHRVEVSSEQDEQRLQAKLVEGMLNEIVEETTSLEYPHDTAS